MTPRLFSVFLIDNYSIAYKKYLTRRINKSANLKIFYIKTIILN